ncbi:AAA family ATPase [Streptomyces sp. NRRL B-1347]|uniref:AAA family ATPase n=1 Tax=Streptomyces sp. NRRL B-1347 TaxID=1476877 RepID=UPI001F2B782E|nr:AAA family ATPase [Streptomyces sp. NRRL B-1347]
MDTPDETPDQAGEASKPPDPAEPATPAPILQHVSDRPPPPRDSPEVPATSSAGSPPRTVIPAPIMATKEHRRFLEFADAVRRKRYVGLCFGAPGVGKTESARAYTKWDQLAPHLAGGRAAGSGGGDEAIGDVLAARAVLYTPKVHSTPTHLDKEISYLCDRLGWTVELMLQTGRAQSDPLPSVASTNARTTVDHAELLIVDEADRLKTAALEQLRDHHDRTGIGLILIGMPGIEKRLARYPQLYSRVGFVHHYKPLSVDEQAFVLARHWPHLRLGATDDFATTEAIAAITRATNGNFRLTTRLVDQIERVLEINQMTTVTKEVVEAARENLVIGIM